MDLAARFRVIGHRGFPVRCPENTMLSFRTALEAGADGFELDVRLTRDGVPVVLHDETVKRTAGRDAHLSDLDLEEVRRLDAGRGERVPTVEEVFAWAARTEAVVAIELKEEEPALEVARLAEKHGLRERCVFASFWPDYVAAPRERGFPVGFLFADEPGPSLDLAREIGALVALPSFSLLSEALVREAKERGLAVVPWTVNDEHKVRAVKRWGCDGLITDDPGLAVRALGRS